MITYSNAHTLSEPAGDTISSATWRTNSDRNLMDLIRLGLNSYFHDTTITSLRSRKDSQPAIRPTHIISSSRNKTKSDGTTFSGGNSQSNGAFSNITMLDNIILRKSPKAGYPYSFDSSPTHHSTSGKFETGADMATTQPRNNKPPKTTPTVKSMPCIF
jgi:hypothetical protein